MIFLCSDNKTVSKNIILCSDRNKLFELFQQVKDKKELIISRNIIDECLKARFQKQDGIVALDFFDNSKFDLLRSILLCDLDYLSKMSIINNLSFFDDYLFFVNEIFNNIKLEEVNSFDIDEILEIKRLSDKNSISSEASDIVLKLDSAKNNYKVLELSKKIKTL